MPDIFVNNNFYMSTSSACIVDLTPPVFSGINFLDVESRGQIRAGWPTATDSTPPIRYEVYIQASTATGLFNIANIVASTDKLQYDIFTMPDGSFLVNGTTYYVGIRAVDAVNNRDSNTVSLNVISTGVLTAIDLFSVDSASSIDESGLFNISMWANKNGVLAIAPGAVMGPASYQVYDQSGAAVVGMSGSVATPDAQGLYIPTSVTSLLQEDLSHYTIKVTVSVDGENRVGYSSIENKKPTYSIEGISYRDNSNLVSGSFWALANESIVPQSRLGNAEFTLYRADGTLVGVSETGISPDAQGVFTITQFALPSVEDPRAAYMMLVTFEVDGVEKTDFINLEQFVDDFVPKAQFSINALNQLQGSFWGTKSGIAVPQSELGTASYIIYDKDGTAIPGLTESGLTADSNGLYKITPVSAVLLTDLTHYTAKVTMTISGISRVAYKGFTLLGT